MSIRLPLTLACGDYEIVRALKDGTVQPDGIALTVLTEMDFDHPPPPLPEGAEFDVAEVSGCSYIVARGQGLAVRRDPGVPASPLPPCLRLHQHAKGIKTPKDLIGRKVGLKAYQAQRRRLAARHPRA